MINFRLRASLLIIGTVLVFGSPAVAKPSDWADIVDTTPKKKIPYDKSRSVERAPIKFAQASPRPAKAAKASKADTVSAIKAKKAPRRATGKRTRR